MPGHDGLHLAACVRGPRCRRAHLRRPSEQRSRDRRAGVAHLDSGGGRAPARPPPAPTQATPPPSATGSSRACSTRSIGMAEAFPMTATAGGALPGAARLPRRREPRDHARGRHLRRCRRASVREWRRELSPRRSRRVEAVDLSDVHQRGPALLGCVLARAAARVPGPLRRELLERESSSSSLTSPPSVWASGDRWNTCQISAAARRSDAGGDFAARRPLPPRLSQTHGPSQIFLCSSASRRPSARWFPHWTG